MRMISATVMLTPKQIEELRRLSSNTKVPASEYIREGIARVLRDAKKLGLLKVDGKEAA